MPDVAPTPRDAMGRATARETWEGESVEHWRRLWNVPSLEVHDSLPSTNDRLRVLADRGARRFSIVIAEEQTAGRGRAGRSWVSRSGAGLWMSVLVADAEREGSPLTPLLCGLAAIRAVTDVAPELSPALKWPNDVLVRGRKLCGILCEGAGSGIVAGIGMNVRHRPDEFPEELRGRAVSLEAALGRTISRSRLAGALIANVRDLSGVSSLSGRVASQLADVDALRGHLVRVSAGSTGTDTGVARGMTPDGALKLEDSEGRLHEVRAGSVDILPEASTDPEPHSRNGA